MQIRIDKKIPLPKRSVRRSKWGEVLNRMQIGDSILFKNPYEANSFRSAAKAHGYSVTQRSVDGGIRVWRIK